MPIRLAALTAAAILFTTAASARIPQTVEQCRQLITTTEKTVTEQADHGQKARDQVSKLMAKLHEQCEASQFEQAEQTAADIRGLVATE